jgi:pimeloyl-ACP methyl ester carboxylesterase
MIDLLHGRLPVVQFADPDYWQAFLLRRRSFIARAADRIATQAQKPVHAAALFAAERRRSQVTNAKSYRMADPRENLRQPILFVAGEDDDVITPGGVRMLHDKCRSQRKDLAVLPVCTTTIGTMKSRSRRWIEPCWDGCGTSNRLHLALQAWLGSA